MVTEESPLSTPVSESNRTQTLAGGEVGIRTNTKQASTSALSSIRAQCKEPHTYAAPPAPSVTKVFFLYAVLPLLLIILPNLFESIHSWWVAEIGRNISGRKAITTTMSDEISSGSASDGMDQEPTVAPSRGGSSRHRPRPRPKIPVVADEGGYGGSQSSAKNSNPNPQKVKENKRKHSASKQPQPKTHSSFSKSDRVDPKSQLDRTIQSLRAAYKLDLSDPFKAIKFADALRKRDLMYHDGGSVHGEAIESYLHAIDLLLSKRKTLISKGQSTKELPDGLTLESVGGDEFFLDYGRKSLDGLISAVYSNLAKVYFMANMFEDSVDAYEAALDYKPNDMDALSGRASSYIILGKYAEAAADYNLVLDLDQNRLIAEAYTGLAKVLVANESVVPGGWDVLVNVLKKEIPKAYEQLGTMQEHGHSRTASEKLKRMHLVMFQYHDVKSKNANRAWYHLTKGLQHKMSTVEPFNADLERMRLETTMKIFHRDFWPEGVGSRSKTPIFIIGFVRSGSTLLERILDSHPLIVGTGEDSIFNGRLEQIRDGLVSAAPEGFDRLRSVVQSLADQVESAMKERWKIIENRTAAARSRMKSTPESSSSTNERSDGAKFPKRFVDKMLTNYMNVGFINMLFPRALILHVAREPMDTLFSAYKHDFPSGHLDYLSEFESLAQIYDAYRRMIEHWDEVLPGRVTHIRYEDLVHDTAAVAEAIIKATGLPWDPDVLNFHKKKQAVNTLSTNQVRKGIYKDSIKSWKRYEEHLQPLVKLVGKRALYPLRTSLHNYSPPS